MRKHTARDADPRGRRHGPCAGSAPSAACEPLSAASTRFDGAERSTRAPARHATRHGARLDAATSAWRLLSEQGVIESMRKQVASYRRRLVLRGNTAPQRGSTSTTVSERCPSGVNGGATAPMASADAAGWHVLGNHAGDGVQGARDGRIWGVAGV